MVTTIMNNGGKSRTCIWKKGADGKEDWYFEDTGERLDSFGEMRLNLKSEIAALKNLRANVADNLSESGLRHFDDAPRRMSIAITHLQEAELWLESIGALR
jgi:hypothetical protein